MSTSVVNAQQLWQRCLQHASNLVEPTTYKMWFAPIQPIRYIDKGEDGEGLYLGLPSAQFYAYLGDHFAGVFEQLGQAVLDSKVDFCFEYPRDEQPQIPLSATAPAGVRMQYGGALEEGRTFENFHESECNRIARTIGASIAHYPGQAPYNVAFFFGPSGVGKTHLCNAIGIEAERHNRDLRVCYIPCSEFEAKFVAATRSKNRPDFIRYYQQIDVLIIDDIQGLIGKEKTQQAFFEIFNHLTLLNKQIILTSDTAPANLQGLEERMRTRIQNSVFFPLDRPDLGLRVKILRNKATDLGLSLSEDIITYIAQNMNNNVRELEGIIKNIQIRKELHCRIDLPLVQSLMSNSIQIPVADVTLDRILDVVGSEFEVEIAQIKSNTREAKVSLPRQVVMYLAKQHLDYSLTTIAERLGRKNHTTIMHGIKAIQSRIEEDKEFSSVMERLSHLLHVA